ncbi:MAG: AmpG family muropeptide MFS transporter [Magnetococcus sp. WYHC-3]
MGSTASVLGGWLQALSVYRDRRMGIILLLGFSSGLPLALTFGTLSLWLAEAGVDKATIGLFAMAGLPYTVKFLWAPLVDRMPLPWLSRHLGRRRAWGLASQGGLILCILALGQADPRTDPAATALWALLTAWFSATQDIVIDAYRVEILDSDSYGAGAAMGVLGYRLGMLASGAGALYLAAAWGWQAAYEVMALLAGVGLMTLLLAREPPLPHGSLPQGGQGIRAWLREAVWRPLAEFLSRRGAVAILGFILLYKMGDALAGVMSNPFYADLGFSKTEIAEVSKLFGMGATLLGSVLGGVVVKRLGVQGALLLCGVLQLASNLVFMVQAQVGRDIVLLMVTIGFENLAGGMGSAAFVAYLSGLCHVAYTATQYALLSSLMSFGRTLLSSSGGWLAEHLGWTPFFLLTALAALPGLLLLLWLRRRGMTGTAPVLE